jgi:phage-related protein
LRLTGRDGIARAIYVTAIGRRVVVVRAFVKKTQRTPRAEIKLALRRAKEGGRRKDEDDAAAETRPRIT